MTTKECYDLILMAIPSHLRDSCSIYITSDEQYKRYLDNKNPVFDKKYEISVYHWIPNRFSRKICDAKDATDLGSCYHEALKQLQNLEKEELNKKFDIDDSQR